MITLAGQGRPAYFLYHALWVALDWVFPPSCAGCGRVGLRWCDACQGNVRLTAGNLCPCCGEPETNASLCRGCLADPPEYQSVRSYGDFSGPLREALHRLKYQRDVGAGEALSKHLIELYNHLNWNVDVVTPVPLSSTRIRQRGYNQAGVLARPLAYSIQKPYRPAAIWRTRETQSQVSLSRQERKANVNGAFKADEGLVRGKTILVIDDVATTGSTINACAKALRHAGASAVFGLTLARAVQKAGADDQPIFNPT
jgi:competence protein ComFC